MEIYYDIFTMFMFDSKQLFRISASIYGCSKDPHSSFEIDFGAFYIDSEL